MLIHAEMIADSTAGKTNAGQRSGQREIGILTGLAGNRYQHRHDSKDETPTTQWDLLIQPFKLRASHESIRRGSHLLKGQEQIIQSVDLRCSKKLHRCAKRSGRLPRHQLSSMLELQLQQTATVHEDLLHHSRRHQSLLLHYHSHHPQHLQHRQCSLVSLHKPQNLHRI